MQNCCYEVDIKYLCALKIHIIQYPVLRLDVITIAEADWPGKGLRGPSVGPPGPSPWGPPATENLIKENYEF